MKIQANWINDYLSTHSDAKTMADRLERAGIEIEQIISAKKLDDKIIVARIKKVIQHPNADRLKLVDVDTGTNIVHVVCGAPNVAEGLIVALAQVGSVLPDGTKINVSVIRGEESNGMLCSGRELGMNDDHAGIIQLEPTIPIGTTLCDIVLNSEILDLTTAANRFDLQSVLGLAREIAAQGGEAAKVMELKDHGSKVNNGLVSDVEITTVKRYVLAHVKLGKTGESPDWMRQRLEASGLRPINAVVDITNYVMLEVGQPLHAFDAERVKLPVGVRSPLVGEKLTTLDGAHHPLSPDDLVIVDANGPLALAGVMGGITSEITTQTKELLLEAASFDGATVRRMAARHGLRTEASSRFERNVPSLLPDQGLARAVELLREICGAEIVSVSSPRLADVQPRQLSVSLKHIVSLLGMLVDRTSAAKALSDLGFAVGGSGDSLELSIPWWRPDVSLGADIVEEIGRTIGYDNLPPTLPAWESTGIEFDHYWSQLWRLKAILRGLGIDEVVTYSFVSRQQLDDFDHQHNEHLKLKNPLSIEQAYLRSALAPSLVATVARNARNFGEFGLFEVSKVFVAGADHSKQPDEPLTLGIVWRHKDGYIKVKHALDTIGREFHQFRIMPKENSLFWHSAQISLDEKPIGWIGEIKPSILARHKLTGNVGYLEMSLLPWLTSPRIPMYKELSKYPSIIRDLSVVLPLEVLWADVQKSLSAENLTAVAYLSEYHGEDLPIGAKALALRLTFSSLERTLTDDEAEKGAMDVMKVLETKFKAKLRT